MDTLDSILGVFRTHSSLFLVAAAGVSVHAFVTYLHSPWRKLPPGPTGLPLLGNIFQTTNHPWKTYTDLQKKFGDLVYLNLAGNHMVIINSQRIAADLLDRRASIYSDRPRFIVASELMSGGLFTLFARYGDVWRRFRKAAYECMNKDAINQFHPTQQLEGVLLAHGLLAEPEDWEGHLRRTTASSIMSMVYDHPPLISFNDTSLRPIREFANRVLHASLPGAYLVESFPWLMHLPKILTPWRQEAEALHVQGSTLFEGLMQGVQDRMKQGEDCPSVAVTLLRTAERHGLSERENAWLAGGMYASGTGGVFNSLAWWMLAMLAYPETQSRAQAELDAIVGRARFPTFADFDNLPYIRAMVKEALRWYPSAPLGFPRRSIKDDWYEGHFIPAGSTVIVNVWNLNRNPETYGEDATHFDPARHLDEKGEIAPGPTDSKEEGHFSYGFGKRICPGRHITNSSLFIWIATVLWAMNIERVTDSEGKPVPIDVKGCVGIGIAARPIPFKVKVRPRFPEAPMMLELERESHGLPAIQRKE